MRAVTLGSQPMRTRWADANPRALLLLGSACAQDAFWRASKLEYERARSRFHAKTAAAAVALLLAAQDVRPRPYAFADDGGGWWGREKAL